MIDPTSPGAPRELGRAESLNLLGSVGVGRVVFTHQALPTIRPVNHVLHDGCVIVRTHPGAALLSAIGTVVAYEADFIHEGDRIAWSVIAVGYARRVGARELTRFGTLPRPWLAGEMTEVIRIDPELVTGFALDGDDELPADLPA
ncbi:pyridoxamine 5'-phosphate oxidase family protein [Amycolatopsis thermoflava]|uniref:pyridoxamine 5'-phosphate oxidase family protein n=1 Tax=Amycolatopsis thermoflava TaxID=84480 RepID=UPI00364F1940